MSVIAGIFKRPTCLYCPTNLLKQTPNACENPKTAPIAQVMLAAPPSNLCPPPLLVDVVQLPNSNVFSVVEKIFKPFPEPPKLESPPGTIVTRQEVDGMIYCGDWLPDVGPHGNGYCERTGESHYIGQWWNGKMHGIGEVSSYVEVEENVASVTKGVFAFGKCNGHCEQTYRNGDVYKGNFVAGVREGLGTYRFANGDIYEGYLKKGLRAGAGSKTYAETGITVAGYWENNVFYSNRGSI